MRTRDVTTILACEEQLDARSDRCVDEQLLRREMGLGAADAAEDGVLVLEGEDEGRWGGEVCGYGRDGRGGGGVSGGWADDGSDGEVVGIRKKMSDDGGADVASWLIGSWLVNRSFLGAGVVGSHSNNSDVFQFHLEEYSFGD